MASEGDDAKCGCGGWRWLAGACRSMVRCGYCGQHWAHMDCVVWEGREAGENSERDDKLAAALGE